MNNSEKVVRFLLVLLTLLLTVSMAAQQRSAKRGISWGEDAGNLRETAELMRLFSPGVSWMYNWGIAPANASAVGAQSDIAFVPMCWNAAFNEASLREYLGSHPSVRYLLGFNEPNIGWQNGGSQMTPAEAVPAWKKLEKIADDFNLKLVAPALNFSGARLSDGVVYSTPFEWLEAFIKLYPTARMDYLCLHSYMDYAAATRWFATDYFYATDDDNNNDLYSVANRQKYPNLIKYFETYGEKPMFLTEFCAFGNSGFPENHVTLTQDVQIDHMTQRLQYLEKSDKVAGYAWFIANGDASKFPYNSLLQTKNTDTPLSELGKVYVYMSPFDKTKYYVPGEIIKAKDYVDASLDSQAPRLRSNSDNGTADIPLQVEYQAGTWTKYQIDVPTDGEYTLLLRLKSSADGQLWIYVDDKHDKEQGRPTLTSTNNSWEERTVKVSLTKGKHTMMLYNAGSKAFFLNSLSLGLLNDIAQVDVPTAGRTEYFYTNGAVATAPARGVYIRRTTSANGLITTTKIIN